MAVQGSMLGLDSDEDDSDTSPRAAHPTAGAGDAVGTPAPGAGAAAAASGAGGATAGDSDEEDEGDSPPVRQVGSTVSSAMAGLYGDASRAVGRAASSGAGAGGATASDSDEEDEGESPPVRQVGSMVSSAMAGLYGDASRAVGRVASSGAGAGDATGGDSDEEDEGDSPPVRQVGSTVSSAMAGLYGDASRAVGRAASSGAGAGGATADDSDKEDEGESPPVRQVGSTVSSAMAGLYGDASRAVGRAASSGAGAGGATADDSDEEDEGESPPVRQVGSTVSSAMAGLYGDASRAVGRAASSGAGAGGATADDSDEEDEGESPPVRQVGSMVSSAMAGLYGDASRAVGGTTASEAVEGLMSPGRSSSGLPTPSSDGNTSKAAREPMQPIPGIMGEVKVDPCTLGDTAPVVKRLVARPAFSAIKRPRELSSIVVELEWESELDICIKAGLISFGLRKIGFGMQLHISLLECLKKPPFVGGVGVWMDKAPEFDVTWSGSLEFLDMFNKLFHDKVYSVLSNVMILPNRIAIPIQTDVVHSQVDLLRIKRPWARGMLKISKIKATGLSRGSSQSPYMEVHLGCSAHRTSTIGKVHEGVEWTDDLYFLVDEPLEQLFSFRIHDKNGDPLAESQHRCLNVLGLLAEPGEDETAHHRLTKEVAQTKELEMDVMWGGMTLREHEERQRAIESGDVDADGGKQGKKRAGFFPNFKLKLAQHEIEHMKTVKTRLQFEVTWRPLELNAFVAKSIDPTLSNNPSNAPEGAAGVAIGRRCAGGAGEGEAESGALIQTRAARRAGGDQDNARESAWERAGASARTSPELRREQRPGRLSNQYAKPDNMSMEVLLQRYNLGEYYQFFDTAKYSMIDISGKFNDQTVEYILSDVEKRNGIRFKSDVRVRLWKALRHIWMHGMRERPKHVRDADVPQVFLPKKDYRQVDSIVKLGDLEPDRQRQIIRKTKPAISSGRGPGIHVMQFEVYRRQIDMWYEFKDLQRCVIEWQRKNPRTMLQEDPREEVMKLRIRDMIHRSDHEAKLATERGKGQFYTWVCLVGIQLVMGSLSALMCLVTYMAYRASPPTLYLEFMGGSKQLISAVSFLQAFTVAYVVIQRRRVNPMIKRYQDTSISCDRLMEQISDFRFETSPLRLAREEDQQKDDKYVPRRKKAPVGSLTDMVKRNGPKAAVPSFVRGGSDQALEEGPNAREGFQAPWNTQK
ncbi:unnamed protein product [Prorocentrum cordatum]|uniref:C2 domain-containing protein n=1 Tax=Prorocentrum cordatum TaxID=2364126 RepID=A0ABN9RDP6_9DINO|nr:unnamed protein product [Polarella glacialis]